MPDISVQTHFIDHQPEVLKEYKEYFVNFSIRGKFQLTITLDDDDIDVHVHGNKVDKGCMTIDYLSYTNAIFVNIIDRIIHFEYLKEDENEPDFLDTLLFGGVPLKDFKFKINDRS
jgi:hypothetical protein